MEQVSGFGQQLHSRDFKKKPPPSSRQGPFSSKNSPYSPGKGAFLSQGRAGPAAILELSTEAKERLKKLRR